MRMGTGTRRIAQNAPDLNSRFSIKNVQHTQSFSSAYTVRKHVADLPDD